MRHFPCQMSSREVWQDPREKVSLQPSQSVLSPICSDSSTDLLVCHALLGKEFIWAVSSKWKAGGLLRLGLTAWQALGGALGFLVRLSPNCFLPFLSLSSITSDSKLPSDFHPSRARTLQPLYPVPCATMADSWAIRPAALTFLMEIRLSRMLGHPVLWAPHLPYSCSWSTRCPLRRGKKAKFQLQILPMLHGNGHNIYIGLYPASPVQTNQKPKGKTATKCSSLPGLLIGSIWAFSLSSRDHPTLSVVRAPFTFSHFWVRFYLSRPLPSYDHMTYSTAPGS